jgi:hypothetical protein
MRSLIFAAAALAGISGMSALGQAPSLMDPATGARPGHDPGVGISLPMSDKASNTGPGDTRSTIAPTLPDSAAGDSAASREHLRAARSSLVAGRTGQAQQSLEMAETRLLDRSVPQGQTDIPSASPLVAQIRDARKALGDGDRAQAMLLIDRALSN